MTAKEILLAAAGGIEKHGMTPLPGNDSMSKIWDAELGCGCLQGWISHHAYFASGVSSHKVVELFTRANGVHPIYFRDVERHSPAECVAALRKAAR
jgi:hypothetical protein